MEDVLWMNKSNLVEIKKEQPEVLPEEKSAIQK
jgi:hypothetical protein